MGRAVLRHAKSTRRAGSLDRVYGLLPTGYSGSGQSGGGAAWRGAAWRGATPDVTTTAFVHNLIGPPVHGAVAGAGCPASSWSREVDAVRRVLVLVLVGLAWWLLGVTPAVADEGPWQWPLAGAREVSRPFAAPATQYGAGHRGADLPSLPGAGVRAAGPGRVSYAGLLAGRPVMVVVHGELRTTYEPVVAALPVGTVVVAGDVLGRLDPGHLGCPVAACLHWGLKRGEDYLDPVRLVQQEPVRLLPLGLPAASSRLSDTPPAVTTLRRPGAVVAPEPARAPPHQDEPTWSLRSAELPLGAAALGTLVLGITLLARPRSGPDDPAGGSASGVAQAGLMEGSPMAEPMSVVDLDAARLRRAAS